MKDTDQLLTIAQLLENTRNDSRDYTHIVLPLYRAILDMATNHVYSPQAIEHKQQAQKLIATMRDVTVREVFTQQLQILIEALSHPASYATTMNYIWLIIDSLE